MSLLRRRMMLAAHGGNLPVTNPELVYTPNTVLNRTAPYEFSRVGFGASEYYRADAGQSVVIYNPLTALDTTGTQTLIYNSSQSFVDYFGNYFGNERTITIAPGAGNGYFRTTIVMDGVADSYCYNQTTGQVYYAGINTPYYGKQNIND